MHFPVTVIFSLSLALAASVLADLEVQISPLGLRMKHGETFKRAVPSLLEKRETCSGLSCRACFGSTWTDCPNSDSYCFDTSLGPASTQCSAGSGGESPTSTGSASPGTTDSCYRKGATCKSCFGAGSVNCPSGSHFDCYEPAQVSEAEGCNEPASGGSAPPAPSSSSSSDVCEAQFGAGSVPCGQGYCYNPGEGAVCCGDGTHCPAGTRCVVRGGVYKCDEGGSGGFGGSSPTTSYIRSTNVVSSGIANTATSFGFIGGTGSNSTPSSVSEATRTVSTQSLTSTEAFAAPQSTRLGSGSPPAAGPAMLGKYTGPVAVLAAALLGLALLL